MTAVALLHPDVSPKIVERFRSSSCEIRIQENLEENPNCSAALIFGGDGTFHRYLPELHKRRIPVLVVPSGSGNDFARAMGIRNQEIALQAWNGFSVTSANVREIDLGVIKPCDKPANETSDKEILFCCVAGVGMDAEANARANRMPVWLKRRGGYVLAALESLAAFAPVEMFIRGGEREIRRTAFFIAIGNAHRYGGGMKIAPRAQPDDGLFNVCLVGAMNKLKLLCWVPTIFFGGHLRLNAVEYFQAGHLQVETGRALDVYADGDYACRTPVEISLLPRALKVIVPPWPKVP